MEITILIVSSSPMYYSKMEISEESLDEVTGVIPDEKYRELKNGW